MSRKGKTTDERTRWHGAFSNELLKARGRSETSDFGEMRQIAYTPGLRTRMIACREDRRIKHTPENDETLHTLIIEARAAGWSLGEIGRALWITGGGVSGHLGGRVGTKWESS
jgi:hypothetical protein